MFAPFAQGHFALMHSSPRARAIVFGLLLLAGFSALPAGAHAGGPKAVLELFTSQGCSSCPPADKLLGSYANRGDVIALSFSVDIWDYLGWTDTLASHENTERQRDYARKFGDSQVYTPQMIVNGVTHVVGSHAGPIDKAIRDSEMAGGLPVPVSIALADGAVNIEVGAAGGPWPMRGTLWLVLFDKSRTVKIGKGENDGRTITYRNVVRKMQRLQMWKGKSISLSMPQAELYESGVDGCAVILQTEADGGAPGTILGAAMASRSGGYGGYAP
jgi:hypothetical protein